MTEYSEIGQSIVELPKDLELVEVTHPEEPSSARDLEWRSVNFVVKDRTILKDCWGKVKAGEVCAMMGPSGAGKTSLLNVLAGRSASTKGINVTGYVSVAGKQIDPVHFRRNIAYVMQETVLMATQTPREALRFSASLRLPFTYSQQSIDKLVDDLVIELGLESCKDVLIGGGMIKGISGGQHKRTSIGVEVITDPSLVFLDEPTSGLDSHTAKSIIMLLKHMSSRNTAVLITIHQPSSDIFRLFDKVIFMKEGRIFYQGPASQVVAYFAPLGEICPTNYNPCDFVLELCQSDTAAGLEARGLFQAVPTPSQHIRTFAHPPTAAELHHASFLLQLRWLIDRELLHLTRNKEGLMARFGVTIFLNMLFGLIFLNCGDRSNANPTNLSTHFGGLMIATISSMFNSAQPAMLEFPFERPMFMREYVTGTYSARAYFLSKSCVELPMTLLQSIVQYIIVYNMMQLQGFYVYEILAAWGLAVASASTAVALGCAIADVKNVAEMAPVVFVPQILFAGFFIRMSQIPLFLRWLQYLSAMKYSMNLLLLVEFDESLPSCQGAAAMGCKNILSSNNVDPQLWWLYALILLLLYLGFRVIGAIILIRKSQRFY